MWKATALNLDNKSCDDNFFNLNTKLPDDEQLDSEGLRLILMSDEQADCKSDFPASNSCGYDNLPGDNDGNESVSKSLVQKPNSSEGSQNSEVTSEVKPGPSDKFPSESQLL